MSIGKSSIPVSWQYQVHRPSSRNVCVPKIARLSGGYENEAEQ